MKHFARRAFLAALGAGTAAMACGVQRASAAPLSQSSGRPLRFVGVYTPHGCAHELWQPGPGFDIAYPNSSLAPFDDAEQYGKSFKNQLLVIDGIDLSAGIAAGTIGHDASRVVLTGSGGDGKNGSVDQFLAVERGLGNDTPHASLTFAVGNDSTAVGANLSYARGGTPMPKWIDPAQAFDTLFGHALGGRDSKRQRRLGKSVLDAARADLGALMRRAPASERLKLEQHQVALREIEKRVGGLERLCAAPEPPDPARFPRFKAHGGGERYFDAVTELHVDLLARAMACDLTRFASLMLADLSRTQLIAELPEDIHFDVAHHYDAGSDRRAGTPSTWRALGLQNRYSYSKVARLLQRLDEALVLEDSMVYVSGDMGDPARHVSRCVPTLLAGGAGGHFKMGRYLDLRGAPGGGVPNNRILVAICQAFGQPDHRFGHATDPNITDGRLEQL